MNNENNVLFRVFSQRVIYKGIYNVSFDRLERYLNVSNIRYGETFLVYDNGVMLQVSNEDAPRVLELIIRFAHKIYEYPSIYIDPITDSLMEISIKPET